MRKKLIGIFMVVVFIFISVGWSIMIWQNQQDIPILHIPVGKTDN